MFVTMASYCFEEYGKDGFGYTFGVMMTFAAFGFLLCDEVIFQWTFDAYSRKEDKWHRLYFGEWSESVGCTFMIIEAVMLILGFCAHRAWSARQETGGLMSKIGF
mmetsp:Transcript_21086/g.29131  ORF Transcript_21086/g.29131 Transcript_21086/m.29131 type:complete len:105 (+) Transcript_21086:1246-1560(+)